MRGAAEFRAGWRNLAAATVGLGFGIPGYTAVSSLFFQAVRGEFGWSSAATAGALIALPVTAVALPVTGWLVDRFGTRVVSGCSALLLACAFVWLSRIGPDIRGYYVALIALNLFGCATGPVAYTRLVVAQFERARGAALAIAQFGIALVAAILPPILAGIINEAGWRSAYLLLAATALVGGGLAQLLMRPLPASTETRDGSGLSRAEALRQRSFWLLGTAIMLVSSGSMGLVSQLQSLLLTRGIDARTASLLLSLLAIAVMTSRIGVGRLLDLQRPEWWAASVLAVAGAGAVILLVAGGSLPLLALGILLFGSSVGAELDLMSFFCARLFGTRHYSAIYGLLGMFFYIGIALGALGYGTARDMSGSYAPALAGSAILFIASAALFLNLAPIRSTPRSSSTAGRVTGELR